VIPMLQMSVNGISSREAGALISSLFTCITKALDLDGTPETHTSVLKQASAVLVSFVLKLSEGQLRRVYTALKDWKNEANPTPDSSNATRREAFWGISAALAEQLRSLFLPCISSVIDDSELELQHAVSFLCKTRVEKAEGGQKKRKLAVNEEPPYPACTRVLQQVLLVLERSLRADAREPEKAKDTISFLNLWLNFSTAVCCSMALMPIFQHTGVLWREQHKQMAVM
jgi:hypothetical protein